MNQWMHKVDFEPGDLVDRPKMSDAQETLLGEWLRMQESNGGLLPARSDFSPARYGRMMAHVVIFDVLENPMDFKIRQHFLGIQRMSSTNCVAIGFVRF